MIPSEHAAEPAAARRRNVPPPSLVRPLLLSLPCSSSLPRFAGEPHSVSCTSRPLSFFGKQVRRVRNETLPDKTRLIALVVTLNAFGYRTNQDAGAVLDRLGEGVGFDRSRRPSVDQALEAVAMMERERNAHVEHERGFARRRVREKARGRRQTARSDRQQWLCHSSYESVPGEVRAAWSLLPNRIARRSS